ncbi:hypothetical protein HanRHA438_Chr01g0036161 [Helianthus annuus]|nr:hypothetical protein HanRHA438_Chr01g0036161 [Helianthus annuus]
MSERGHGCGNITMTQAELTDLINTRVTEALAAYQAGTKCTKYSYPHIVYTNFSLLIKLLRTSTLTNIA